MVLTSLSPFALAAPDVEAPDDVAEVVEAERPARRVDERDRAQRLDERLAVVGLAARLLQRGLGHQPVDVEPGGIEAGNVAVVLHHPVDEPLVGRRVEVAGVGGHRDHADRLVAVALQERLVSGRSPAQHGQLEALVLVLLHELQGIGSGEALHDGVGPADLSQVRRVVGRHQRRPELLDDPAPRVLEDALEARHLLVAEREVVGDGDHALELQLLRRVVGQRVHVLRRGPGGPDEVGVRPALGHVLGRGQAQDRHLRLGRVVADREQLERGERAEDHVDVIALDELLGLGLGAGGVAAGVGHHELGLAAGQHVVPVLQEPDGALLHLDPAGGERAGLHGEQADADRLVLGDRRSRQRRGQHRARRSRQEFTPTDSRRRHRGLLRIEVSSSWAARARARRGG